MTIGERILTFFVIFGVPLIIIGVPIYFIMGGPQKFALRRLQRRFEGLDLHDSPQKGDVTFVYHTYRGFLLWFVQDEHHVAAPPMDASILLSRLLKFNLTWGMMSYGMLFVPLLSLGNYYAQKRSIQQQASELLAKGGKEENDPPRSDIDA